MKTFTAEAVEEELRLVAAAFCEQVRSLLARIIADTGDTMRAELIGHFKPCMTEI